MNHKQQRGIKIRLTVPQKQGIAYRYKKFVSVMQRLKVVLSRRSKTVRLWQKHRLHTGSLFLVAAIMLSQIAALLNPFLVQHAYALGKAESLLPAIEPLMASKLTFDDQQQMFSFDAKQTPVAGTANSAGGGVTATAYADGAKGIIVSDSVNKIDFKLTPKFRLADGQKDGNRIVYPLIDYYGWAVYTMTATGAKEDIVLNSSKSDAASFEYEMGLNSGLEARLEPDGGIGVYGNTLFSSSITTGTDKDAELLKKARQNTKKDTLIFTIPPPIIKETEPQSGKIKAKYELNGTSLKVNVHGLASGNYPITIDPSIYVVTASQFMYGNNETNINFDVANKLIKKGRTTGARFDSWQSTANLPTGSFGGGAVASGGYIYKVGGSTISGSGTAISTQGSSQYTVPAGVTSINVKMWGAGGGSSSGQSTSIGGDGGGGGYVSGTISVTPGENLQLYVGGGGGIGASVAAGVVSNGGGGGGHTSIYRGSTPLFIAAGGGGGGGAINSGANRDGGDGGGGGNTTAGISGETINVAGGGGGGATSSSGGAGGGGMCGGTSANGASFVGGNGGNRGIFGGCFYGTTNNRGLASGGSGGTNWSSNPHRGGGGGGGSGYFGGGGGAGGGTASSTTGGSGGGGGGSSFATGSATNVLSLAGNGTSPGSANDPERGTAGNGGPCPAIACSGSVGGNGLIVLITNSGSKAENSVAWAKFDTGDGTVVNANPGSGSCAGWCSSPSYNLPANRANLSLVAYNGHLYAMGGNDEQGPNTIDHKHKTIYVAKLGSNGEPQLWHPTDSNKANWEYWYHDDSGMTLPSERLFGAATAYNNKMYFIGGLDNSSAAGAATSTVWVADILPNGKLGAWTTSTALTSGGPGAVFGANVLVYNDYLYSIGGASAPGVTPYADNAHYIKINNDGTLAGNWIPTNSFATGRVTGGGVNAAIWNGYMYISGGCGATNSNNNCASTLSDTQIASINADGTLGEWSTLSGVTNATSGTSLLTWRGAIYSVGGCPELEVSTGGCNSGATDGILYGTIKPDGEISSVASSTASGANSCTGSAPTNCNLPSGQTHATTVMSNGYLYHIGGCADLMCNSTNGNVSFTRITSDGNLMRPTTCPTGSTEMSGWCRMDTTITGGIGATSATIFKDTIYLVGGISSGAVLKNTVLKATVSDSSGLLSSWTSQSLTGVGATSVAGAYATTRANPPSSVYGENPGYLYIIGGCTTPGGNLVCSSFTPTVYKCTILHTRDVSGCTTSGQLQLPTGRALMGGAEYANHIYLTGGASSSSPQLSTTIYAKFDNSNNIITTGSGWTEASQTLSRANMLGTSFAQNGYLYYIGGYNNSTGTATGAIQRIKINPETGALETSSWQTSSMALASGRWAHTTIAAGAYVYVGGGCTTGSSAGSCSAGSSTVQRFTIYNNASGNPSEWMSSANQYSTARTLSGTAIYNGYIYVAGGCTQGGIECTETTSNIQRAAIGADGSVGSWSNTTASLPVAIGGFKLLVAGGTLYIAGGHTSEISSISSAVYYATPTTGGDITSWSTATHGLPGNLTLYGATVWNDRMYIVGGVSTSCGTIYSCDTVYISPQQSSGGNITSAWTTSSSMLPLVRVGASVVAYANNLYVLGGATGGIGGADTTDTLYTKINPATGGLGSWNYGKNIPTGAHLANAFAANGFMYVIGGMQLNGTVCSTTTLVAPISANTSNGEPTGFGDWFATNTPLSGGGMGVSVNYANGKAYALGGWCGSGNTSPNVQQTTLLAQPQVAKYSLSFDTDTNVYPQSFLINGTDSSNGSEWNLKYRSMSDPGAVTNLGTGVDCSASPMSNWGQETNTGILTLGSLGAYTARDGGGGDMSCARYYHLNMTVDAQTSFGFPEDAVRGPTITDVSLRYTAAPQKRLMHGRTFINGTQNPLDSPKYNN